MNEPRHATYTKIKKTDTWGLRIEGPVQVGEIVLAFRRGDRWGTRKEVTSVVAVFDGVSICEMKNAPKKGKKAPPAAPEADDAIPAPEAAPHVEGAGLSAESFGDSEGLPF